MTKKNDFFFVSGILFWSIEPKKIISDYKIPFIYFSKLWIHRFKNNFYSLFLRAHMSNPFRHEKQQYSSSDPFSGCTLYNILFVRLYGRNFHSSNDSSSGYFEVSNIQM